MKFATKTTQRYPPYLKHFATLPWEIKIQIFCKYSADMGKIQTHRIFSPPILISLRV